MSRVRLVGSIAKMYIGYNPPCLDTCERCHQEPKGGSRACLAAPADRSSINGEWGGVRV